MISINMIDDNIYVTANGYFNLIDALYSYRFFKSETQANTYVKRVATTKHDVYMVDNIIERTRYFFDVFIEEDVNAWLRNARCTVYIERRMFEQAKSNWTAEELKKYNAKKSYEFHMEEGCASCPFCEQAADDQQCAYSGNVLKDYKRSPFYNNEGVYHLFAESALPDEGCLYYKEMI